MENVSYTSIYNRVKALGGITSPTTDTQANIKEFINRRAKMAYESCDFWPRWLVVGESRTITNNIIPFTESGKSTIDKFIRVHKVYQPFYQYSSIELEFYVSYDGAHLINDTSASTTSAYVSYRKNWDGPYTDASTNIPEEWQDYIAQGAYADWLRSDGKNDVALTEEKMADDILQNELSEVDVTRSTGIVAHRISTHVNRAYRRN